MIILYDPATIQPIAKELHHQGHRTRYEALEALEESIPEAKPLVKALELKYISNQVQPTFSNTIDILKECLQKDNNHVWILISAIIISGELRLKELKGELRKFLSNKNPLIRHSTMKALRKCGEQVPKKYFTKESERMDEKMQRLLFLRSVPIFQDLDNDNLHRINIITHEKKFKKNQFIFRENDPGDIMYIIQSGKVHVSRIAHHSRKKKVTLDILEDRDCFGEMAIFDVDPRSATIQAVQATKNVEYSSQ